MLELALVPLVAGAIFLKVAARRDSIRVINMKEFALVPLLALVAHPVHANGPLSLALVYPLLL